MFGPLCFEDNPTEDKDLETTCLLCEDKFNLKICFPLFLKHVFDSHNLVIEGAQYIENLHEYICYWSEKFKETTIEQIIPSVSVLPSSCSYFVLSTLLKEDKLLRHKIKLDHMLKTQEFERNDENFKKACLFCKLNYEGKRGGYLDHLLTDHNIRIGNPQNLVFVDELISHIETKLESLQCLYCEKIFVDRVVLKEHMRKKQHKRINPLNKYYDKFFAVNYLNPDKNWHIIEKEIDRPQKDDCINNDEEYEDWNEPETFIVCLFCSQRETTINNLCLHMTSKHGFNFYVLAQHLDFYQRVKLVNYVRKQVHNISCFYCQTKFESVSSLESHIDDSRHGLPNTQTFDQPEFYFPTYENDSFLYFLEDIED